MNEQISVQCPKDGQVEYADFQAVLEQQKTGFRPWTFCGFCSKHLVFPKICRCRTEFFLLPGEMCAKCGREYTSAIDDYKEVSA